MKEFEFDSFGLTTIIVHVITLKFEQSTRVNYNRKFEQSNRLNYNRFVVHEITDMDVRSF